MSNRYTKNARGLSLNVCDLALPAKPLSSSISLGNSVDMKGNLFSVIPSDGLYVYDVETLEQISFYPNIIDIICLSGEEVIFLIDNDVYSYSSHTNKATLISKNFSRGCYQNNQNHNGTSFMIYTGAEVGDTSRRPQKFFMKVDKNNFSIDWKVKAQSRTNTYILISEENNCFYTIDADTNIHCYKLENGELNWQTDISDVVEPSGILEVHPALVVDLIVLVYKGLTLAISTKDGSMVWQREGATASWGLISTEHKVYQLETSLSDSTRSIITVDAISGELLSSYPLFVKDGSGICNDLAFHNPLHWAITLTHIFIGWSHGLLTAINPDTGEIEWYADLGGENQDPIVSDIVISNNRLYCRTTSSGIENRVSKSWVFEGEGGFGA